jgi:hypothetical protein
MLKIFILFIFCVEGIFAQKALNINAKSSFKKALNDSALFVLGGRGPGAVITKNKDIICVAASWNEQIHSLTSQIDSNGNFKWKNVQLCLPKDSLGLDQDFAAHILPRSDGGAYFAFEYWEFRSFQDGTTYFARYPHLQYVDAAGNLKWGTSGIRLTDMIVDFESGANIQNITLAPDGDIMVYWTWVNDHNSPSIKNDFGTYVQKVDPLSREFKFGSTGKKLINSTADNFTVCPNGNFYMAQDPFVSQNGGDSVYCFNSLAEKQWQLPLQADISIDEGYLGATNNNEELLMIYDNNQDILASLYNSTGAPIWVNKIISSTANSVGQGVILNWNSNSWVFKLGQVGSSAYCVDRSGTMLWGQSGKLISNMIISVIPVDSESVLVAFKNPNPTGFYIYDLYLQKLNKIGDAVWQSGGIKIFENVNDDSFILPDNKGGAYLIIDANEQYSPQFRTRGIYLQKVDKNGNLGLITSVKGNTINNNISTTTSVVCYPNPSNGMQSFSIKTKSGDEVQKIILYDILGREVRKLNIENPSLGETFLRWDGKNNNGVYTAPGIYFYYMKTKNNINISGKLIRIK